MSEQEHKINEVGNTRDFVLPDPIKLPIIVLLPLKTRYSLKSQLVMSVCKVNLSLALCIPNISWWVSWFVPTIDRLEPATEACVIPYWLKLDKVGNLWHNSNHPVCIRLRKKKHISVLGFEYTLSNKKCHGATLLVGRCIIVTRKRNCSERDGLLFTWFVQNHWINSCEMRREKT